MPRLPGAGAAPLDPAPHPARPRRRGPPGRGHDRAGPPVWPLRIPADRGPAARRRLAPARLAGLRAAHGAEKRDGTAGALRNRVVGSGASGRRAGGNQFGAIGSTQRGSSWAARLTSMLTGWAVMSSDGQGASGTSSPASHGSQAFGGRMTGMRPWTGATVSLAAVVRMVQVSMASPGRRSASDPVSAAPAGICQRSHRPAKAKGALCLSANSQGWRVRRCHS